MTPIRFALATSSAVAIAGLMLAPASACPGMKYDHTSDKMAMVAPMSPANPTTILTEELSETVDHSVATHDPVESENTAEPAAAQ
ncbi:MAG: hypothetical protein KDJ16_09440 [Hyphomicrobiales bacterium]|nr:hypothetical protein [Hyphomicrobiales bacterium]